MDIVECSNLIVGECEKKPNVIDKKVAILIITGDLRLILHFKRIKLSNYLRKKAKSALIHFKPKKYRGRLAGTLSNSGKGIEQIHNLCIYQKTRQEGLGDEVNLNNYPGPPLLSTLSIMSIHSYAREVKMSAVYFWTENQMALTHEAMALQVPASLDASGRFIKKIKILENISCYVFLYIIVIRIEGTVYPNCQKISEGNDVSAI